MDAPQLISIQVGMPLSLGDDNASDPMDRPWETGFFKQSVPGRRWLGEINLDGDGQADRKHHGGPEKAVLAYAASHYPVWRAELQMPELVHGAFGENFTISGLDESTVCIGDTFTVGEALIQASQPRQPCWKISRRWRLPKLSARVQQSGRTGWYFRVLRTGYVEPGLPVVLCERPFPEWTIARANEVMHLRRDDRELAAELAACPALAENWQRTLGKRAVSGINPDLETRLIGPNRA